MTYDVIIIGGGQAGLAAGYYLKQTPLKFIILDKENRIGESWRKRYDSLKLFSPRASDALPGMQLLGDQNTYPAKDEIANYLEHYATTFHLPLLLDTDVEKLEKNNNQFHVTTRAKKIFTAKNVIIATGPFAIPFIPNLPGKLSDAITQLHSHDYRNPTQLQKGTTLVVGAGNSGVQIALEIANNHETLLACSQKPQLLPRDIFGKSIFWWMEKLGILHVLINSPTDSILGKFLRTKQRNPVIGRELLYAVKNNKIQLYNKVKELHGNTIIFSDGRKKEVNNIIWATGYKYSFDWVHIPNAFKTNGEIMHSRGISPVPGLYFIGLEWLATKISSELLGVGYDAKYLIHQIFSSTKT